jgi:ribonuclease E
MEALPPSEPTAVHFEPEGVAVTDTAAPTVEPAPQDIAPAESVAPATMTMPIDEPVAERLAESAAAQVAVAAPAPVAPTEPESVPVARSAEPIRIEPYHLPTDALQSLAADAGLEWINSDAEKIRQVQAAMAAEPTPVRQPREPRRAVMVDEGPLVLVETRKDLSQLKLPFDSQAQAPAA